VASNDYSSAITTTTTTTYTTTRDNAKDVARMVGDINLFLLSSDATADIINSTNLVTGKDCCNPAVDSSIGNSNSNSNSNSSSCGNSSSSSVRSDLKIAEVDVMVAERINWRMGFGSSGLGLILQYGALELGIW